MAPHYALVASLPEVDLRSRPRLSLEDFHERCRQALSPQDFEIVNQTLDGGRTDTAFGRAYASFQEDLAARLALARTERWFVDPRPLKARAAAATDGETLWLAARALEQTDPLERERLLDEGRMAKAQDLGRQDPFGLSGLLAHAVRLTLAWRWAAMEPQAGLARAEEYVQGPRLIHDLEAT